MKNLNYKAALIACRSVSVGIGVGLASPNNAIINAFFITAGWLSIELIWAALKPQTDESETESN